MRIKNLLWTLLAAVAIPLVLAVGFLTYQLWQQQRFAYQLQFLERAKAVSLALDTEFDVTLRTLRAAGDATEIPPADVELVLPRRFRRLLENYPHWAAVVLTDAQGQVTMSEKRAGMAASATLDAQGITRATAAPNGYISDLFRTDDGRHFVFVATAITRKDNTQGVIYAVIAHTHWLELLRTYPVSKRGTLTLMDTRSRVISRTLDDEKWVGAKAPPAFWSRTINRPGEAFKIAGLDGQIYYVAFSRSRTSGWILSTGVPEDEVNDALFWKTLTAGLLVLTAVLSAVTVAWRLGRKINVSFAGLLAAARLVGGKTLAPDEVLPIREARTVHKALAEAHRQLLIREESLNASLEREAVSRQQAETSNKSKDKFLAMMGHELRNPLSAITSAIELIEAKATAPEALSRSVDIIRRQSRHLAAMVNDLMDVAQLDTGEIVLRRTTVDLAKIATKVLLRFEETGRCAHLKIRIEHAPAWIYADESRVELLVTCLLDNACKYTPPGGDVILEVMGEPHCSILRVSDTGAGIAPEVASSMFEVFTQGDRDIERSQGGLGLGLALARKLVVLHGGAIEVSSDGPGLGTTFTVTFPGTQALPEDKSDSASALSQDIVVTVVEDIADNRETLMAFLEAKGRRINGAGDGPAGAGLILSGPSHIAVVDIGLPGFSGLELARRVRMSVSGQGVYLIALTGYGTEADRAKALDAGFNEFLVKPFDPESVEMAIGRGLEKFRTRASQKP